MYFIQVASFHRNNYLTGFFRLLIFILASLLLPLGRREAAPFMHIFFCFRNVLICSLFILLSCLEIPLVFSLPKYSSKLLQELRQEGACCLGLLCASLSYEAEKIFKWIFSKFSSSTKDEVKLLYLCATYKALETVGEKKAFSSLMQVRLQVKKGLLVIFPVQGLNQLFNWNE